MVRDKAVILLTINNLHLKFDFGPDCRGISIQSLSIQIISKRKACSRRSGGLPGRGKCVFEMSWNQSGGDPSSNALISSVSSTQFERDSAVDGSFSADLSRAGPWRLTSHSSAECE